MSQDVKVKVTADTNQLQTGLNQAEARLDKFAAKTSVASNAVKKLESGMVTAGAMGSKAMARLQGSMASFMAILGTFAAIKSVADAAGQFSDLSRRFGESAQTIQKVKGAADQSGTSIESVAKAMNKAELAAQAAATGNTEAAEAFIALGTTAADFAGMNMEERMIALADGYDKSANKAEALAAMVQLMGKNAGELVPMFAQGGEAIKEMMDVYTASTDSVERVDALTDNLGKSFSWLKAVAIDTLGEVSFYIDMMSLGIAAAIAYVSNLGKGFKAAKQAYSDTIEAGLDYFEDQKKNREERKNKISKGNILAQQEETDAEEKKKSKKDESAEKEKEQKSRKNTDLTIELKLNEAIAEGNKKEEARLRWVDSYNKARREAKDNGMTEVAAMDYATRAANAKQNIEVNKELKDAEEKKKKTDKDKKKEENETALDKAKDNLAEAKKRSNVIDSDQLRKIGGGFAKSNYTGLSKEEQRLQKQIDLAQKQYDQLKQISDSLKGKDTTDGITS